MSRGPADVMRRLGEALNHGDFEQVAGILDPDVVAYGTRGGIDQDRIFRGRDAVLEYWNEVGELWESLRFEPEKVLERGDVGVVFWRERGRSPHSDVEMESETASVFRVRDGSVVEVRGYLDRGEALRAAGIAE